jgi:hypothetical protein
LQGSFVSNHIRSLWVALAVAIVALSSTSATGADKCGSLDRAANAIHMAQILYPELKGKEFSLQFSEGIGSMLSGPADVGDFLITVDKPEWHPPAQASEQLGGVFQSQDGTVEMGLPQYLRFTFIRAAIKGKTGAFVGRELSCWPLLFRNDKMSQRLLDAEEVINAHPEWTDEQDVEAARKLGMQYGPDKKDEILRMLPLKELSSVYGLLTITEATFRVAGLKEPGSNFADLHWYVIAKRVSTSRTLRIAVEPFQGKVTGISE